MSKSLQILREAIHEEYREVVERRVFTGFSSLLISVLLIQVIPLVNYLDLELTILRFLWFS